MTSRKVILSTFLQRTGLGSLLHNLIPWSGILVLNYHRIGDGSRSVLDRGLWSATADDFDAQIAFCKRHLTVIGADELPEVLRKKRGQYVMISFDDGYRDNFETAFPILKRHNVPATFFVTTGFIDNPGLPWWDEIAWMVRTSRSDSLVLPDWLPEAITMDEPDREGAVSALLRKYKALPDGQNELFLDAIALASGIGRFGHAEGKTMWMSWKMLRQMQAGGMTIGGHTVTHPILARISPARQEMEIRECGSRIYAELGEPMRVISYHVGRCDTFKNDTRASLRNAGVEYAFSYYGGFKRFHAWDDYDIRRVAVERDTGQPVFHSTVQMPWVFA